MSAAMTDSLKPAQAAKEDTSPEAIRKMIEALQRRNYLAGSDAAITWLFEEIMRDVRDSVW